MQTRFRIILIIVLSILALAGYLFYLWYYQSVPQAGISLLPVVSEPKTADKILVFSPHPDDETIAAGGFIKSATQEEADVWIVLVTDGNKHHLKGLRYEEFFKATSILGVDPKHLIFLNYPDGKLNKQNTDKVKADFKSAIEKVRPTIIISPSTKDIHPDHKATGTYVDSVISDLTLKPLIYRYLVHYHHFPQPEGLRTDLYILPPLRLLDFNQKWLNFPLSSDAENTKLEATLQYKSQLKFPPLRYLLEGLVRKNELFSITN